MVVNLANALVLATQHVSIPWLVSAAATWLLPSPLALFRKGKLMSDEAIIADGAVLAEAEVKAIVENADPAARKAAIVKGLHDALPKLAADAGLNALEVEVLMFVASEAQLGRLYDEASALIEQAGHAIADEVMGKIWPKLSGK